MHEIENDITPSSPAPKVCCHKQYFYNGYDFTVSNRMGRRYRLEFHVFRIGTWEHVTFDLYLPHAVPDTCLTSDRTKIWNLL